MLARGQKVNRTMGYFTIGQFARKHCLNGELLLKSTEIENDQNGGEGEMNGKGVSRMDDGLGG